jgi:hypothetical protein
MAELIIIRTLLRCWTVSDSEEGFNLVLGRNATLLLNKSGGMLLLKVIRFVMVLRVCGEDGDFMLPL